MYEGTIKTVFISSEHSTINMNQVLRAAGYTFSKIQNFLLTNFEKVEYRNRSGPMKGREKWIKLDSAIELCQGFSSELIAALETVIMN